MTLSKRLFDIGLALLFLVPVAVLVLLIGAVLLVTQGRPIFYGSERMRDHKHGFTLWKFRSMRQVEGDSGVSGGDKSARITRAGHALRAARLDELPQLLNILKGDMSFVGPRPPLRQYVDAFPALYEQVLKSRPGLTGLASLIYHRHEQRLLAACANAEETNLVYSTRCVPYKARLDLIYQRHQSICLDIWILARTVAHVVLRP